MARGWESKSVEDQQAQYAESGENLKRRLTPIELAKRQVKDGLMLNRKRIVKRLEGAHNPQHRTMLEGALSHLDTQIESLG